MNHAAKTNESFSLSFEQEKAALQRMKIKEFSCLSIAFVLREHGCIAASKAAAQIVLREIRAGHIKPVGSGRSAHVWAA